MGRALKITAGVVVLAALYVGAFLEVNHSVDAKPADVARAGAENLPAAGETLDIVIWNLGYGGLGAGSDFATDGGQHYFPPSRDAARANAEGIHDFLAQQDADIVMLQELAHASPVNYWVNVKARVDDALAERERLFFADFKTRLLPWPLRMEHGQGIYSRVAIESSDVVSLPAENAGILGVRRRYAATVARLANNWTIVTTHLAAFDENGAVRTQQLRELLAWAEREHQSGRRVVIGGDFNLQLAEAHFPSTTEERFLFWIFPFPPDALPPGWRIAADANTPSVRTNERPYHRGENHRTVIDGFIVSPNVIVEEVKGVDLDFQNSDHNPVHIRVRALPASGQNG